MRIKEDRNIDIESTKSLSEYVMSLRKAIDDETAAIAYYDKMLENSKIPDHAKKIIQEIVDDEKDHLVILTELFNDEVSETFSGYGDD